MTIHWCGTGLSSIPGLRRLIEAGNPVTVWNRTVAKAQAEVGDLTKDIRPFSLDALAAALRRLGDGTAEARRRAEQAVLEIQGALVFARAFDDPKVFSRALKESERRLLAT